MASNVKPRYSKECIIESFRYNDNGISTNTSKEQIEVEKSIHKLFEYARCHMDIDPDFPLLKREEHVEFLKKGLLRLSSSYQCLDASRPWLCYWILHSLDLLDEKVSAELGSRIAQFLAKCQSPTGGFGGGPGQEAHLATTYAAVNTLCILGTKEAFQVINRDSLKSFIMRMKTLENSFHLHCGGEVDIRSTYLAASVAKLTNIMSPEMFHGTAEWIYSCQTYEGGFSGCPGMEAHGGYSFCGLAALLILGKTNLCDLRSLLRWTANRQMKYEGGFQGRTGKLVDGCYSFWQGGAFPLIHMAFMSQNDKALCYDTWMFDVIALQEYLLTCCQCTNGGMIDKPNKPRDYYHTCYCLSGLTVAQHFIGEKFSNPRIFGPPENELKPAHPVFNISGHAVLDASCYFSSLSDPDG